MSGARVGCRFLTRSPVSRGLKVAPRRLPSTARRRPYARALSLSPGGRLSRSPDRRARAFVALSRHSGVCRTSSRCCPSPPAVFKNLPAISSRTAIRVTRPRPPAPGRTKRNVHRDIASSSSSSCRRTTRRLTSVVAVSRYRSRGRDAATGAAAASTAASECRVSRTNRAHVVAAAAAAARPPGTRRRRGK